MTAALVAAIDKLSERIARLEKAAKQPERMSYRPREVAELTGIGYDEVLRMIHDGELPALKVGRLHIVPAPAVDELVAQARKDRSA